MQAIEERPQTFGDAAWQTLGTTVLGEHGLPWLARTGLPGRLVARDGCVHEVGAWPRSDW